MTLQTKKRFKSSLICSSLALIGFFSTFTGAYFGIAIGSFSLSYFRLLVILIAAILFFINVIKRTIIRNLKSLCLPFVMCLFIWFLYSILQLPFTKSLSGSIKYMAAFLSIFCMLYTLLNLCTNKFRLKFLLYGFLAGSVLCYGIGLYESLSGSYIVLDDTVMHLVPTGLFNLYPPRVFFGNINNFALYVCIVLFISLLLFSIESHASSKAFLICMSVLSVIMSILINSRAGLVGVALLLLSFCLLIIFKKNDLLKVIKIGFPVGIIGVFFLLLFYFTNSDDLSNLIRFNLYRNAIDVLFRYSYGFGVGLGQAEAYLSLYTNTYGVYVYHSFIFEILSASGVFIFSLAVIVYYSSLRTFFSFSFDCPRRIRTTSAACFSYLCCFLVASFGPSSCLIIDWVWLSFAVLLVVKRNIITKACSFRNDIDGFFVPFSRYVKI